MSKQLLYLILFIVAACAAPVLAQNSDIPERPNPPKLVNDFAGILTASEEQRLEDKLVDFDNSSSTQIVVVTVKSLNGYDRADFTYRLAESWGVGQKGSNNGVVLMVKPKYSNERGQTFIATGYGLEGVIPDATAKSIVENELIPYFKRGDIYGGIDAATDVLMGLAAEEFTPKTYKKKAKSRARKKDEEIPGGVFFFLGLFVFLFFFILFGAARAYSADHKVSFWIAVYLLLTSRAKHKGKFGDFTSGGGYFGGGGGGSGGGFGGGGGGFGGFGGGSFGGGGAGGSW